METTKINPLLLWLKNRVDKNKNAIVVVNGETGSGKTYAALRLAQEFSELMGTSFSIKGNVDFKFDKLVKKAHLKENEKKGTCFVFEEVGAMGGGASAKEWQSKANTFFNSFLQTSRHRNHVLFLTCPLFSNLEASSRKLCHIQICMKGINQANKRSYIIPYRIQINNRTGDMYFKLLRYSDGDGLRKRLSLLPVKLPDDDILKEYEEVKTAFTTELNKVIMGGTDKKKPERRRMLDTDVIMLLKANGYSTNSIADKLGVTKQAIQYQLKLGNEGVK